MGFLIINIASTETAPGKVPALTNWWLAADSNPGLLSLQSATNHASFAFSDRILLAKFAEIKDGC